MEVWYAKAPAGMSPNKPVFDRATLVGQVCDVFKDQMAGVGGWEQASSVEAVLDLLHIECARMICGYSLHKRALQYDAKFCGLDWYYQHAALRRVGRNKWERGVMFDQVCPAQWFKARILDDCGECAGWGDRAVGQVA